MENTPFSDPQGWGEKTPGAPSPLGPPLRPSPGARGPYCAGHPINTPPGEGPLRERCRVVAKGKGKGKGEQKKQARSAVTQAMYDVSVPPELLERAKRDAKREKYLTPFTVAQKYNVSISTARKLLRMLAEEGVIVYFSRSRRSPVYVPAEKAREAPRGI